MIPSSLPHIVSVNDLYCNYDVKNLRGNGNIKRIYKCADKQKLVNKIFLAYMHILMEDFTKGGKVFMIPDRYRMEMRMRRVPSEQFKKARQAGAFAGVDILMSGFLAYEPILYYRYYGNNVETSIKLSHNYRDQITEKTNTGYKYC